jgi:PST family polysaccharide transporter
VTVQVVLQLGFIAALARIISPEAFGVMAIALVVVGFIEIFAQVGIGPALIQYSQVSNKHRQTAFIFSLALGVIFFAGTWLAAPALAEFYEKPLLTTVLRWIALSFIISGASVVPRSMLIKEMRFKSLFISSAVAMVLGNLVIGLGLALNGADIFAYVFALLAQNTILSIGYWIAYPGPIGLKMDKGALKDMVGYGGRSTVFNVINYAAGKIDTMIVGAYSGNWTLTGFYDRSAYLMGLPVTVLGKLGDSVLFSGLSMMQEDLERLRSTVLKASHAITTLVIPLTALLVLRAEDFTVLLLGEQYIDATPIVSILFLCVALRSFIKIGDASMRATDHLGIGAAIKLGFLIAITGGVWWAMNTFGLGDSNIRLSAMVVFIATAVQTLAIATWLVLGLKVSLGKLLKSIIPGLILCLPVIFVNKLYSSPHIDYIVEMSWRTLPELGYTVSIAIHILGSAIIALSLLYIFPELFDGGFPELRRKLLSRIPNSRLKTRLTR